MASDRHHRGVFAGLGLMVGLVLRRDRVALPVWVLLLTALLVGTANTLASTYPTAAARRGFAAATQGNPVMTIIYGPVLGDNVGALTAWRLGMPGAILFALFSIVATVRHSRAEEYAGRAELLRSGTVGRCAQLGATLSVVGAAHVLIGLLALLGLLAHGLPPTGCAALVAAFVMVGWAGCAIAALACELATGPRAAIEVSLVALAGLLLLRMLGDGLGIGWLLAVTPVGWLERLRPFTGEHWSALIPAVTVTALLVTVTLYRSARRDLGAGWWPTRPGPATASRGLTGSLALVARLNRGTLAGVSAGFAVIGLLLGSVAANVGQQFSSSPQLALMLARLHVADAGAGLVTLLSYALAEVAAIYAVTVVLRPVEEERSGRAALLLVAGASRAEWMGGHLLFAVLAPVAVLLALAVGIDVGHGLAAGGPGAELGVLAGQAVAKLPAIWALVGFAAALVGLLPRIAPGLAWSGIALIVALEFGWELGVIDRSVFDLSPFAHVYPDTPPSIATLLVLTSIAVAFAALGFTRLRARDFA